MKNYRARLTAGLCGLALALSAAVPVALAQTPDPQAGEMKPIAVVVISSYEELMADVDFIGGLAGQPQASQQIEGLLMAFTQQKGLAGLDKTKPIGVMIQAGGPMGIMGVACVPVTDLNELLGIAAPFGVTSEDMGNGIMQIKTAQGPGAFVKNAGGWALLSISPDFTGIPDDPSAMLAELDAEYDLAVRINVQNVPEAYRQMAVDTMQQSAQQGLQKQDGESDDAFAARKQQVEAQLGELKRFIQEMDQFTLGFSADSQQQRALVDFAYTAVAGSKLAEDLAAARDAKTNYAGFVQDESAATLAFAGKVTASDAAQFDQMVESFRVKANEQIDQEGDLSDQSRETLKSAFGDFVEAVRATFQAGVIDGAGSLNLTPESLTIVAGGFNAAPEKVESALKKLAEVAKEQEKDMPEVKWAADKHGDVTFHTLAAPVPEEEEEARQLFGEYVDVAVGIGKQSVYFALGRDSLAAVKQAIDQSASKPDTPVDPLQLTVTLGQIMNVAKTFADDDEKPQLEMIANMLSSEAAGKDHIRVTATAIDNGVRGRFEAEEGVLKAIGMSAMQAQAQAAGAGF